MRLLVISDAHLIEQEGKKVAYAPYVTEMDMWMHHVEDVTFISPGTYDGTLLGKAFKRQDFKHTALRRLEFHTLVSAIISLVTVPYQAIILWKHMRRADHIHMRAPGNLTLLAGIVAITLSRKRKTVKYAGNFSPTASQPVSYKWQKWLFSNTSLSKNTTVMAYGEWPGLSKNIKSFFTATYNEADREKFSKTFTQPLQLMFVGTLSQNKNPQLLVELLRKLNNNGMYTQAHFYGDGPMMEELRVMGRDLGTQHVESADVVDSNNSQLFFHGNQPAAVVKEAYKHSHFLFLASQSEGWPKVVAEAMWHGCIPITTRVSCIPWMLGITLENSELNLLARSVEAQYLEVKCNLKEEIYPLRLEKVIDKNNRLEYNTDFLGTRGIIYRDQEQVVKTIQHLLENQTLVEQISENAQRWAQEYTLERFEHEIVKLLQL